MGEKRKLVPEEYIGKTNGVAEIIGVGFRDEKTHTIMFHVLCHRCGNVYYLSLGNFLNMSGNGCVKCRHRTHGMKHTRIYNVWKQMKHRCQCKETDFTHYKNYRGRGITVCSEWQSFENFYKWAIENGYREEMYESGRNKITLDRIDNDGEYSPKNCRFVTHVDNQWNKRTTIKVIYYGEEYNLKQLSELLNVPITCLKRRIKSWDMSRWGEPLQRRRNV